MSKISKDSREALKLIPSIDDIIKKYHLKIPLSFLKHHINFTLDSLRQDIIHEKITNHVQAYIDQSILKVVNKISRNSLRQVVNGTGIILHTGLGRAPISKEILIDSINNTHPYTNLEVDISNGKRGDRNNHVNILLNCLCNSESSIIVNNNASAVMLMLNSICENKEVIISRGQQVEIGGSFRIPDVIKKSNCNMIEVGTTNKTHMRDYKQAITCKTGAILYVHTSNFKVIGFSNEVKIVELANLAHENNIPLIVDLGSGSIADYKYFGLPFEKMINKYVKSEADIISFSGDKLLGGPQAGILVGKKHLIKLIFSNPLYRAFRCDKIRISMMESILRTYISSKDISSINLSMKLFKRNVKELTHLAENVLENIKKDKTKNYHINIKDSFVEAGSGSLPNEKIPSIAITIQHKKNSAQKINQKLLNVSIPIIGYINNKLYHIDLKAIPDNQIPKLINSINEGL